MSKLTEALFPKATHAVLATLFMRPEGLHLRGLMSATGLGSASAQRELKKLLEAGILTRRESGNSLLYQPNTKSPVYADLRSLIEKVDGVAESLRKALLPFLPRMKQAFVYGSVARAEDHAGSDIDLLVISDALGSADLYRPANRQVVFQRLPHTLGGDTQTWRLHRRCARRAQWL